VYALVAAVGGQFSFVHQVQRHDRYIAPYRFRSVDAPDNLLNRLVLQSLDRAIASTDPGSERIHLSLSAAAVDAVAPALREEVAIASVVAQLEKNPQRSQWDRIVVVTPAYSGRERDGLAGRLQGFGIFAQPLRSGLADFYGGAASDNQNGDKAITPGNETIKADTYLAPYSYVEAWVLDPKTLAVLEKRAVYDNQKISDPKSGSLDLYQSVSKEFLAGRIANVIDRSVYKAVTGSELRGNVEIGVVKPIPQQ
jgi:hypothetical protein